MRRLGVLAVGLVCLMGLAGCNEHYRGYGSGYRPSYGGGYSRGYDNRNRDSRNYRPDDRGNPGYGRSGGGSNRGNPVVRPGLNYGDPPANHPGN